MALLGSTHACNALIGAAASLAGRAYRPTGFKVIKVLGPLLITFDRALLSLFQSRGHETFSTWPSSIEVGCESMVIIRRLSAACVPRADR
jgi:hypothetical protein